MPTEQDEDNFLMGGDKVPTAGFTRKGDRHEGVILDKKIRQQTEVGKSRKLKFFPDGSPMNALVVILQTDEIDDDIEDDDGRRQIWLEFKKRDAVAEACKAAGVKGIRIGGYLAMTMTGQEKPKEVGLSGAKLYEAEYTPPNEDAETDAILSSSDDAEPEPAKAKTAKPATSRAGAPPKPAATVAHHGPWVEDDYHYEDEDGNKFFAVDGEWVDYIAPPVAKKAPAKKAAPKPPSNDEDSF